MRIQIADQRGSMHSVLFEGNRTPSNEELEEVGRMLDQALPTARRKAAANGDPLGDPAETGERVIDDGAIVRAGIAALGPFAGSLAGVVGGNVAKSPRPQPTLGELRPRPPVTTAQVAASVRAAMSPETINRERAKDLPVDPILFVQAVKGKRDVVPVNEMYGNRWSDFQPEQEHRDIKRVAGQLAWRLGLTTDGEPTQYQDNPYDINSPMKYGWRHPHDGLVVQNLLNPKSATFKKIEDMARHGGAKGKAMSDYEAAMISGASAASAAIVRRDPSIKDATTMGLVGRAVSEAMSPTRFVRTLVGDSRTDDEVPAKEQIISGAVDLLLFGGLSGLAEKGAALIGKGAVVAARNAASRGILEGVARRQIERGLAQQIERYATAGVARTTAQAVVKRGAAAAFENAALQIVPALGQASDLTVQNGRSFKENLVQVGGESARGFVRFLDGEVLADPEASAYEKTQSAISIGLFLLGAGAKGYDKYVRRAQAAGIHPEVVDALVQAGSVQRGERLSGVRAAPGYDGLRGVGSREGSRGAGVNAGLDGGRRSGDHVASVDRSGAAGPSGDVRADGRVAPGRVRASNQTARAWEREVFNTVTQRLLSKREASAVLQLWRARAAAWVREGRGRTVDDFYRRYAPKVEVVEGRGRLSKDALAQYADYRGHKHAEDRFRVGGEDLEPYIQGQSGSIRVAATMADQAKVGYYFNPKTGAKILLAGGPEGALTGPAYGRISWVNQKGPAGVLQKAAGERGGLAIAYSGNPDAIFSSAHAARVMDAELQAAIRNGTLTEGQALELVQFTIRAKLRGSWKGLEHRYKIPDSIRDFSDMISRDAMTMPHRHELFKAFFPKAGSLLPDWETVRDLMVSDAVRGARPGDVMAALHIDPHGVRGSGHLFGVNDHFAYNTYLPGINLGLTNLVNIRDLFPDQYEATRKLIIKRMIERGEDPSRLSDGTIYSRFRYRLEKQRGASLLGITNAERLYNLVDLSQSRRTPYGGGAESGMAADVARVAGRDGAGVPGGVRVLGVEPRRSDERVVLEQRGRGLKGSVSFAPGERPVVRLFQRRADVSTFLHESAHVFRRTLSAPDLEIVSRHFGEIGTVGSEEGFARSFERYLYDGSAPTAELRGVFARFKAWLGGIYGKVQGTWIGANVHPEVRDLFDRMLGGGEPVSRRAR